jgi:hypothetical protein
MHGQNKLYSIGDVAMTFKCSWAHLQSVPLTQSKWQEASHDEQEYGEYLLQFEHCFMLPIFSNRWPNRLKM